MVVHARPDLPTHRARRYATALERRPARRATVGVGLVGLLALAHLAVDAVTAILPALLPALQDMFGLSESALAALVSLQWLCTSLSQPALGSLADRYGPRRVGAVGLLLSVVLTALVTVVPRAWMLYAAVAVGGLGSAAFHPAALSLVRRRGLVRRPALGVSFYSAAGTAGMALGPLAVLVLMGTVGLVAAPLLMLPGALLAVLMFWRAPDLRTSATGPHVIDRSLLSGPVGRLTLATMLATLPAIAVTNSLPLLLSADSDSESNAPIIGITLALFSLAGAIGGVLAAVSSRIPRRVIVPATMVAAVPALIAVLETAPGTVGYFTAVAASGALVQASLPLLTVAAQDVAPRQAAVAGGMIMGLGVGAAGLLYLLVGVLQQAIGILPAVTAVMVLPLVAAGLAYRTLSTVEQESPIRVADALAT
jgi:FSR family fosmidomycin resistance protein-like MFS transporter